MNIFTMVIGKSVKAQLPNQQLKLTE